MMNFLANISSLANISGDDRAMETFQGYLKGLVNKSMGWLIGIGTVFVVLWAMYIGVKIIAAKKAEQRVEAKELLKQFILGTVIIFVLMVGAPLLIQALIAWAQSSNALAG